jgi:hypothetical protein
MQTDLEVSSFRASFSMGTRFESAFSKFELSMLLRIGGEEVSNKTKA